EPPDLGGHRRLHLLAAADVLHRHDRLHEPGLDGSAGEIEGVRNSNQELRLLFRGGRAAPVRLRREGVAIRVVRLGSPRTKNEGLRIGTVRRPPRGVPKTDFAKRDFYDVWLPDLSPSEALVKQALAAEDAR